MGECCICHNECDGSLMRMDMRYNRVRMMITDPAVPRIPGTDMIALCKLCQRRVHFAGGFLKLLVQILRFEAGMTKSQVAISRHLALTFGPRKMPRAATPHSRTVSPSPLAQTLGS